MAAFPPLPPLPPRALLLAPRARRRALAHLRTAGPNEGVGLLAGRPVPGRRAGVAAAVAFFPLPNRAADPVRRFQVEAADLARLLARLRRRRLLALAVVHSHPAGPPRPSPLDALGAWPELATVVVSPGPPAVWRAFARRAGESTGALERRTLVARVRRGRRPPPAFDPARLARQMALPEVGRRGQERLARARVLLVGLGGLGSPAALYLAAAGVGTLGLSDPDRVEVSNLHRQVLYAAQDVGRPKAEAAAARLAALAPGVRLRVEPPLTPDGAPEIVARYDLVVHGTDRYGVRDLVNRVCRRAGRPWVDASVYRWTLQVAAYTPDGPCYRCHVPLLPAEGEVEACDVAGVAGPVVGTAGTLEAVEALKILLGAGDALAGRMLVADLLHPEVRVLRLTRRPHCPVCSSPADAAPGGLDPSAGEEAAARALERGLAWPAAAAGAWRGRIVDLRAPARYALGHLAGAVNLPWATPDQVLAASAGEPVLLVCERGLASARLALALADRLPGVRTLAGGMAAVEAAGDEIPPPPEPP
jgi:molybdopterin/thiamine biosynthesis adenylyltransferase/proteasome lid subunit RPN8/RPN11/rhodanese-related sulfurtransferase